MGWKMERAQLFALFTVLATTACQGGDLDDKSNDDAGQSAGQSSQQLAAVTPTSANPWLALLPPGTTGDYDYWAAHERAKWAARGFSRRPASFTSLVSTSESEVNDTQASADPVTGFGTAADPQALITGTLTDGDVDFFSFTLQAGDVIAGAIPGVRRLELRAPSGALLVGSSLDVSFLYPEASPLPGDRVTGEGAAFAYVVNTPGTYALSVQGAAGSYQLELEAFRPALNGGGTQTVFVDFDGATVDPGIFGGPPGDTALSPLASFLPRFGLTAADQNAVINAVMAEVRESLSADLAARGLNPRFALDLRNSRDNADPFGSPNVSRVVVGGTVDQLGLVTIGIAQTIDPGNFGLAETGVVLLDLLSDPPGGPASLADIPRAEGTTLVSLIGRAVGSIVAHEAGHYLGNFHTTNANPQANTMDEGGDLLNTIGVGPDGVFGTPDDVDVDFGVDTFSTAEGFAGSEDTLNTVAFATSGQTALGVLTVSPATFCNATLRIELSDSNLSGAASVTLSSSNGDSETRTLAPLSGQPGLFTGTIAAAQGAAAPNNGSLQVQNGATVTARYQDANNGSGAPAVVTTTLSVDCAPPAVTDVRTREGTDIGARVVFNTSELATSRVDFGTSCSALNQTVSGLLASTHSLPISGLTPDTTYFYALTATDRFGNAARADNGGACFSFRTATRVRSFFRDFEAATTDFLIDGGSGPIAWHLTTACSSSLPGHSRPRSLYFGSDATCSYAGDGRPSKSTATSPAFTVNANGVVKLRFNYLLETNGINLIDFATVSVSINGGPFKVVATNRTGTLPETGEAFRPFTLDLRPLLGGASSASVAVRFGFDTKEASVSDNAGFYVDDVEVVTLGAGNECTTAAQCDDGIFCNGAEVCVAGRCSGGRAPCEDGVFCTNDICDEQARTCLNAPQVFVCLDNSLCNGVDVCDPQRDCVSPGNPCPTTLTCSEAEFACIPPCRSSYFDESFEPSLFVQFEATPTVTVNTTAGDHPGTNGRLGIDIDDTGSVTTFDIQASTAPSLRLNYWMEVNAYDSGEAVRVQYCAANCDAAGSWVTVNTVGGTSSWRQYTHNLPNTARTDTLRLRWVSNANGTNEYAHIDEIFLIDPTCNQPLPPTNPQPPTAGPVNVSVTGATGEVRMFGTASDPNGDIAYVDVFLTGPGIPFAAFRAVGTTSYSTRLFLAPGVYFTAASVTDREGLTSELAEVSFTVPIPSPAPPGPSFSESFEQGGLSQFTFQGAVTVNTTAGDHPGATGALGADIDDIGRLVSRPINASASSAAMKLSYWMDVNAFDAGEFARVAFCPANCNVEASWVTVNTVGGTSGWRSYQHALPASANTATLQVRWVSGGTGFNEYVHIDDIVVGAP